MNQALQNIVEIRRFLSSAEFAIENADAVAAECALELASHYFRDARNEVRVAARKALRERNRAAR
jgi:hypothetical protein